MKNNKIKKWETSRLLENLDEDKKVECIKALEECSVLSLENEEQIRKDKTIDADEFFGYVFPLVRRLFDEKEFIIPAIKFIFNNFYEYYKKNYNTYKKLEKIHDIDGMAELMEMYLLKLN